MNLPEEVRISRQKASFRSFYTGWTRSCGSNVGWTYPSQHHPIEKCSFRHVHLLVLIPDDNQDFSRNIRHLQLRHQNGTLMPPRGSMLKALLRLQYDGNRLLMWPLSWCSVSTLMCVVSLCSSGYSETYYIDQAGLELERSVYFYFSGLG